MQHAFGLQIEDTPVRTRCGYHPSECIRTFEKVFGQAGPVATGRCLHYAADIVCSGGLESFLKVLWDYALTHIGLASPRAFVYLKKRVEEIHDMMRRLPDEHAYSQEEFQVRVGELVLVLREAPTRAAVPWPKVGAETHAENWIRAAAGGAPETVALRRTWRPEGDLPILRTAGAEICKAVGDGSTEKALFWIKWLFEKEANVAKEVKGGSLTTLDRGVGTGRGGHGRGAGSGVGGFILELYGEIYKELAEKGTARMNEEFQCLVHLWKHGAAEAGLHAGTRKHIMAILTQIVCEVPRWKVPAAPTLIKDPVAMSVAIRQVPKFFREVLAYAPPKVQIQVIKAFKSRGGLKGAGGAAAGAKAKKGEAAQNQMEAFDKALEAYFSRA